MRLLETTPTAAGVPQLREFIGSDIPPYAILSHTWAADEVTLQQLAAADLFALQGRARFTKVQQACALARTRDALNYVWVDTCCIDKTSSAELSEAINSMFAWYRRAEVCYVYLSDLGPCDDDEFVTKLPTCRWFTRGWTLQELVAPRKVLFFDRNWNYRGSKEELAEVLSTITNIPVAVLRHEAELSDFAIARRMSWASYRQTTRVEDMAYCLLGIFDVNLSLIYGEGAKAFARLQTAILQTTPDLSIFAWVDDFDIRVEHTGVLATHPMLFSRCSKMEAAVGDSAYANFTMTTRGIQTDASLIPVTWHRKTPSIVALDTRCSMDGFLIGVFVRKIGGSLYVRCRPSALFRSDRGVVTWQRSLVETLTLATSLSTRFPFHSGPDPVVGNRFSTLRVGWGPLVEWARDSQQMPRSHFDTVHGVFFSCDASTKGWCAYVTEGTLPGGSIPGIVSEDVYLKLFFACFEWNTETPVVVLASLNSEDLATGMLLESLLTSQLDQLRFESCQRAKNLVFGVLKDSLVNTGVVCTDSGMARVYEGSKPWTRLHSEFRVELNIWKEARLDVCVNPTIVFDISFAVEGAPTGAFGKAPGLWRNTFHS